MGCSRNSLFLAVLAVLTISCTEKPEPAPAEFVHLYGDLRIAAREFGESSPDGRIVRVSILKKYGWTAVQFDSVAECIQNNSNAWEPFQDSVSAYVDSLAIAANAIPRPPKPVAPKEIKR